MKNVRFGAYCLGLLIVIALGVASLGAQADGRPSTRERRPMADVHLLRAGGAQLGVMVSDLDATAATNGVKIDEVNADSPADKAGIKAGDIVVDFDGERVRSARQFTRLVQETPEGRSVAIGLMRDGKKQTVNATPEAGRMTWDFGPDVDRALREAERGMRGFRYEVPAPRDFQYRFDDRDGERRFQYRIPAPGFPGAFERGRLGVSVQSLTDDLEEYFGATNGGALVSSVTRDSAAAKAGIKAGDVIISINGKRIADADQLIGALEGVEGEATIVVLRDKKEMTLKATLERPSATVLRPSVRG